MLRLALKMLYGDRAKYAMLICGLTFCSLLMTQQASVFCGLMLWTAATDGNIQAPLWVADAKVEQVDEVVPLREIEVQRVRSVPGVEWAVPLSWHILNARLANGSFQAVQVTGLDTATLVGRPARIVEGRLEDLRLPDAVIIDQVGVEKFKKKGMPIQLGSTFEINDKAARVVGICITDRSFLGYPFVYTTYDRAVEYEPPQRQRLNFVLAKARDDVPEKEVIARINRLGGLRAFTGDEMFYGTIWWYFKNTGIPLSFGTVVILGIVVGIAISGQTFYLFIHENLRFMAALKAMGARTGTLAKMVFLQALTVGFVGYGLGVGLATWFGHVVLKVGEPPFFMPWWVLAFTGTVILFICCLSAFIGLMKIVRAEPAMVFK